jgi:phage-related minor tail protein
VSDTSLVFALSARDNMAPGMRSGRQTVETETAGMADAAESNGSKMGTALAGAGAAAGALAGAALMSTFMQAMDMSEATTRLEAQLSNTTADVGAATDAMKNVFTNGWGESATEVGDAIKSVTLNMDEFTGNQQGLEDMTTKTMALSKAFDQDLNTATASAGQMVKTGMADNFDEAMDLIAAGLGSVANKSDDLLETFNEYPTQFRRLGLDGKTAMGLISQGLEKGAKDADAVADALGIFGEMALGGGKQVDAAFKSIGLNGDQMGKLMRAGGDKATDALQQTMDALRGTDDETTRLAASQVLFGDLANTQADALFALDPASAAAAGGFDDVAGAADKVVKKLEDSPAMKMEAFKRGVQQNVIDFLGGTVIPAISDFKSRFQAVFSSIWAEAGKGGTEGVDRVLNFFVVLGQRIGEKARELGPKIISGLADAGAAVGAWVMANPEKVLKIAAIAAAITMAIVALPTLVAIALQAAAATMMIGFVGKLLSALGDNLPKWWASFTGWVSAKAGAAGQVFSVVGTAIGRWFSGLWSRYISGPVSRQWNSFITSVQQLPGRTGAALGALGGRLATAAATHWQRFKDASAAKATSLITWVQGLPGRISRALGSTGRLLYSKGADVIRGLWNGIQSMGGWLWNKVTSFVSTNVVDAATSFLNIGSPSKLMADEVGHWLPPGIAEGAEDNRGVIDKTMAGLVDPSLAAPPRLRTAAPMFGAQAGGAGALTIRYDTSGAYDDLLRLVRKMVHVEGGGSTERAFGHG